MPSNNGVVAVKTHSMIFDVVPIVGHFIGQSQYLLIQSVDIGRKYLKILSSLHYLGGKSILQN